MSWCDHSNNFRFPDLDFGFTLSAIMSSVEKYAESVRAEFESKLQEWVEIPTISADPDHHSDIERGAEAAVDYLRAVGAVAEKRPTKGNPVVVGKFITGHDHPTVTIYNHLDVQPANEPQWLRPPFVFHKQGDRYIGRGSTDDKGPALSALFGARYAVEQGTPVNVQFIWELEEEIGSPNFEEFVKNHVGDLRTDSVAVSDTIWIARGRPAIAYGLRGLVPLRLQLETGTKDVHSGLTGGGARNPLSELCQVLAECYDARAGRVRIPGFYDDVLKLTRAELDGFLASGFSVQRFKKAHELKRIRTGDAAEMVRRIWAYPTFEVHGLAGGYTGPGVKTAIAPRAEAKISMRLVPNQNPDKIFRLVRDFIRQHNSDVKVIPESFLRPYLGPKEGAYAEAARDAMQTAFGKDPALVREGGSIGAVVTMQKYLKAPIVFLGLSLPEHGYHAPNENFDWEQASGGIRMFARYFDNIARLRR
jgi:acetylornithine deacetylase/succinyl-diaminopimelate desuccinylase-like protein